MVCNDSFSIFTSMFAGLASDHASSSNNPTSSYPREYRYTPVPRAVGGAAPQGLFRNDSSLLKATLLRQAEQLVKDQKTRRGGVRQGSTIIYISNDNDNGSDDDDDDDDVIRGPGGTIEGASSRSQHHVTYANSNYRSRPDINQLKEGLQTLEKGHSHWEDRLKTLEKSTDRQRKIDDLRRETNAIVSRSRTPKSPTVSWTQSAEFKETSRRRDQMVAKSRIRDQQLSGYRF